MRGERNGRSPISRLVRSSGAGQTDDLVLLRGELPQGIGFESRILRHSVTVSTPVPVFTYVQVMSASGRRLNKHRGNLTFWQGPATTWYDEATFRTDRGWNCGR